MIPELVGFVTRREGKKFLKLSPETEGPVAAGPGRDKSVSLYIHIPFCRSLCPFCCFNRYLFNEAKARRYFQHLRKELDFYIERGFRFSDFYFGGGTPTILMDELSSFIDYLNQKFDVKRISLETTPREINPDNVSRLRAMGIKRLSLGVQSFDDAVLKSMGRLFLKGEEVKERLRLVQGKFDTVNVDFVFNFPGQSLEQFKADVRVFKDMGIDQATFYPLMASPHKRDAMERRFNHIDTSMEKKFYDIILKDVYGADYKASTVWCFSREDKMIDEYIINSDDYIGIGSGSVSILGGEFFVNTFSLEKYGSLIEAGRLPIVGWRKLSTGEYRRYYILTKLFGLSLDLAELRKRFHPERGGWLITRSELLPFTITGIVHGRDRITVTPRGMYTVSVMMREFFASLNGLREQYIEKQI